MGVLLTIALVVFSVMFFNELLKVKLINLLRLFFKLTMYILIVLVIIAFSTILNR
jgi:hypothetical protein